MLTERIRTPWFGLVLAGGAVLLLGTSRPLSHRILSGTLSASTTQVVATATPMMFVGENVNNQGCGATETLDIVTVIGVRNNGATPLVYDESTASILVDGQAHAVVRQRYSVAGEWHTVDYVKRVVAPGESAELRVSSTASLPVAELDRVQRVEVVVPVSGTELRAKFDHVQSTPVSQGFMSASHWKPAITKPVPSTP